MSMDEARAAVARQEWVWTGDSADLDGATEGMLTATEDAQLDSVLSSEMAALMRRLSRAGRIDGIDARGLWEGPR